MPTQPTQATLDSNLLISFPGTTCQGVQHENIEVWNGSSGVKLWSWQRLIANDGPSNAWTSRVGHQWLLARTTPRGSMHTTAQRVI